MISKNVAVRHGRRAMVSPVSKATLRRFSTTPSLANDATSTSVATSQPDGTKLPPLTGQEAVNRITSTTKKKQKALMDVITSLGIDSAHQHTGSSWAKSHQLGKGPVLNPAEQFAEFNRFQKQTVPLGSSVTRRYRPTELLANPPKPEDLTLELLMASQTHMGHNTSNWNPANARYIYGVRQGIHIISLETTAAHLRRAARVVEEVSYRGGLILFVGTRKGHMEIVTRAAEMAGACQLFTKWTPGGITNRDVILQRRGVKVVDHKDKELDGFDNLKNSARPLVPELVVCLNPLENYTLLYECGLASIPTIGVVDTNADPTWVTYTIPANDDSLRSMALVGGVLGRAGEAGQKRRLADAKRGQSTWQNRQEVKDHIYTEIGRAMAKRKEVMGRFQENLATFSDEESQLLQARLSSSEASVSEDDMLALMGLSASDSAESSEKVNFEGEAATEAQVKSPEEQVTTDGPAPTRASKSSEAEKEVNAEVGAPAAEVIKKQLRQYASDVHVKFDEAQIKAWVEKELKDAKRAGQ